jgi:ABC-type antimicrobial peptide transport system permease subunit
MLRMILKSVWYYRKINIVVLLAVAISTAVIGGALIVGDSVRYSLRQMTLQRLGHITHVMQAPSFFRQQLAADIDQQLADFELPEPLDRIVCSPAMLVNGSVERSEAESIRRAGSVTILGVDPGGWDMLQTDNMAAPQDGEIVLGYRTATELQAGSGDTVTLWVELPSSIPRDSLLGEREETTLEIELQVSNVLPETAGASRFDLNPGQQLPFNAFVSLTTLQERMGLEEIKLSRRNPIAKPARINTVLVGYQTKSQSDITTDLPGDSGVEQVLAEVSQKLNTALADGLSAGLTLEDVELRLRTVVDRGYVSVESERMILSDPIAEAVMQTTDTLGLQAKPTLVYLANEIAAVGRQADDKRYSMYSIVAGLPFDATAPLGPFQLNDGSPVPPLSDSDIILSSWLAEDLAVSSGDQVTARWHEVGSHGELPELDRTFTVKGIFAAEDPVSVDQDLTPVVEGITDVESFSDWDQPFDMEMDRITGRDDDYWADHRATPKAFVSLATAEQLWNSRYGRYTSIRVATVNGADASQEQLDAIAGRLQAGIPGRIAPEKLGLFFRPIRQEGLQASVGANDFTQLFIGFSFFLILSAIILASLMFRLGVQQRISQLGLLHALGWPQKKARRFFVAEGTLVSCGGALVGAVAAIYFGRLMILGLTTWWVGAVGTQFLLLHVQPVRLVVAAIFSVVLAFSVIWTALLHYRHISPRELLTGKTDDLGELRTASLWWRRLVSGCGITSVALAFGIPICVVLGLIPGGEAFGGLTWRVVCFFLAGFSCLAAGLFLLQARLQQRNQRESIDGSVGGILSLSLANAARNPQRSLLTTALIAFATFVIVAVGAGRRNPLSETPDLHSGNGGFSLVAESSQPVLFDLNTTDGRTNLGFSTDSDNWSPATSLYSFSVKPGSDASCVNLYQTRVPTLLGASDEFLERGGFRFADTPAENPWLNLSQAYDDVDGLPVIPVIGDMNTLQFSLKKGLNDVILVPSAEAPEFALQIVGMLDSSIFQGVLVMSNDNLHRIDPDVAGSRYFLIETDKQDVVANTLESQLNEFGMDTESVSQRLAGFLAVQNTYLSTFQMLGGLGLLVGTFGLAAVMMRNVVERRREIALLRAVGFTTPRVCRLILVENWLLLIWGIGFGTISALLAMLPHLLSTGADVPWQPLGLTLVAVVVIGSLASLFAVRRAATVSIRENLATE